MKNNTKQVNRNSKRSLLHQKQDVQQTKNPIKRGKNNNLHCKTNVIHKIRSKNFPENKATNKKECKTESRNIIHKTQTKLKMYAC